MECSAHNARKCRLHSSVSSIKQIRNVIDIDPGLFQSTTDIPSDPAENIRRTTVNGQAPQIGVIGGGMAGLRCAKCLADKGCRVIVFEARSRLGGRVYQTTQSGRLIDMGSNWIHGSKNNPILKLAHELDDTCFEPPEGEHAQLPVFDEFGNEIDSKLAIFHSFLTWDIVEEAIRYSRVDGGASIHPRLSLMDYFNEAIKVRKYDESTQEMILKMSHMWSNIVGEPIHQQSLRYMWLEECIEGENWFLASTYKRILENVRDECMAKAKVQMNSKVTSIESIHPNEGSQGILLTTDDGSVHGFDEVVTTAPLGWLKRNLSAFKPQLPRNVTKSIAHIGYGRLEKVYVNFPRPFWQPNGPEVGKPFIIQFLAPAYSPKYNYERWPIECVSLAALPEGCEHATLLFYVNGPCSEYVTSLVRDSEPGSQEHYERLQDFFSPYYSRLPYYDTKTCKPISFCNTDWQNDEFAGNGSYTTFQTSDYEKDGLVELDKDIDVLRVGCPERRVWFAGEHTAPTLALGTTTGAYWSGEAVAERIAKVYGLDNGGRAEKGTVMSRPSEL